MYFDYYGNFKEKLDLKLVTIALGPKLLFLYLKTYIVETIIIKLFSNHENGNTEFSFFERV